MSPVKTKDNCEILKTVKKKRTWDDVWHFGNDQKQSQGNLKTVKLTKKQSYETSHGTLKTHKKVVMVKLKTGEKFEKMKHHQLSFF